MGGEENFQTHLRIFVVAVISFAVFSLFFIPQVYFYNLTAERPTPWGVAIGRVLLAHTLWAALTPPVVRLGLRFKVEGPRLVKNGAVQILLCLSFAIFHALIFHLTFNWFMGRGWTLFRPGDPTPVYTVINTVLNNILYYSVIQSLNHAVNYLRRYKENEYRLQKAELQILRSQLHPHFLFNTLNAISALAFNNPETAARVIALLSDLLRFSFKGDKGQEIRLKDELDFLGKYVQIQQILLQERLKVEWDVSPETLNARVPNMLLQPLVENSIRHGIEQLEQDGWIKVSAALSGNMLRLEVRDNGAGLMADGNATSGFGIGLVNTQSRLKYLYGDNYQFRVAEPKDGGLAISITIPFRQSDR